ncbi:MAG: DUF2461 domain-containing protein [Oscillospiraceae bacterium]|nr:DUF2461 domain-containing protein [Oscillospiraceae bacterium]
MKDGTPMFSGFSERTGSFLWELAFNNERPWFLAHKQEFEDYVNTPFKALAADTYAELCKRLPDFEGNVHISRIYRDARRLFGRGPYKDHLWFTVWTSDVSKHGPAFWFEISPSSWSYGVGFWEASPVQMETFRRSLDANPARFLRMAKAAERGGWQLMGEPYKRPKALHGDPLLDAWYNRKYVGLEKSFDLGGAAFTEELPRIVAGAYVELMPLYRFLAEVWRACPEEPEKKR